MLTKKAYTVIKKKEPKINVYHLVDLKEIKNVKVEKDEKIIKVEIREVK